MLVQGVTITDDQVAAGRAAMVGDFLGRDVGRALRSAGVTGEGYIAGRAADRLLQTARKEGRITVRRGVRGGWRTNL